MFLGFVISKDGLKMDDEKVKAILEWPIKRSMIDVKSFHDLAIFYRNFIKNFSCMIEPIVLRYKNEFTLKTLFSYIEKHIT